MNSVLLGGLKVFLINDGGFPLSAPGGRAKFFKAGTSTPETVYSDIDLTEGTSLGPVVYTDALGALPAIWLKTDRLYKVVIEQKVSDDPEVWAVLWEVDNVGTYVQESTEVTGDPSAVVSSISALKAVDHGEHSTVQVLGYYAPGDWGNPSTFVYDADSTASADDGAYVEPNDHVGRWVQVFSGDVLDVRKFGAIPDLTENSDVTAKVVNAVNYAQRNSSRSRPLTVAFLAPGKYEFVGDFDFTQYADFVDLSDNSHHKLNWLIGEDVVFKGDNSDFTLSSNTVCLTREALIEGASATLSIEGGGAIKVDPAWWGSASCTLEDCYVECHSVTTNTKSFTDCVIVSNGYLNGYVNLSGCGFEESWFVDGFNWLNMVIADVSEITVYNCTSGDSYIDIMNKLLNHDYGDLGGRTVTGKSLLSVCTIENAVFDGVTLLGDAVLRNVRGTFEVEDGAELTLVDCELEISDSVDIDVLNIQGGSIGRQHSDSEKVTIRNTLNAKDCGINVNVLYYGDSLYMDRCIVAYDIEQNAVESSGTYYLNGNITGCVFTASHVLLTDDTGTDTVVNIIWKDNTSSAVTAIDVSGITSHVKTSPSYHGYVYEGNIGTFLPSAISNTVIISDYGIDDVSTIDAMASGTKAYVARKVVSLPTDIHYGAVYVELDESYTLFSIGTLETFVVNISVDLLSKNSGHGADEPEFMDIIVPINRFIKSNTSTVSINSLKGYVSQYIYNSFIGTIDEVTAYISIRMDR